MARITKISDHRNLELYGISSLLSYEVTLKYYGECIKIHHSVVCDSYIYRCPDQASCDVHLKCVYYSSHTIYMYMSC